MIDLKKTVNNAVDNELRITVPKLLAIALTRYPQLTPKVINRATEALLVSLPRDIGPGSLSWRVVGSAAGLHQRPVKECPIPSTGLSNFGATCLQAWKDGHAWGVAFITQPVKAKGKK